MELLIARCAGLDVHQATVVATVRTPDDRGGRRRVTETFGTMTPDLLALREWLCLANIASGKIRLTLAR